MKHKCGACDGTGTYCDDYSGTTSCCIVCNGQGFLETTKDTTTSTQALSIAEQRAPKQDGAIKFDDEKVPLDLLPFEALEDVCKVLQFGAKKYDRFNWRKGMKWGRLLAACLRHLFAWARREEVDPESGQSHLAHAIVCLLFVLTYQKLQLGEDDRYGSHE